MKKMETQPKLRMAIKDMSKTNLRDDEYDMDRLLIIGYGIPKIMGGKRCSKQITYQQEHPKGNVHYWLGCLY